MYFLPRMTTADQPARLRWARSQRFRLTSRGLDAERDWRARLAGAQGGGRAGFDAAAADWAKGLGLEPDDGSCLGELSTQTLRLEELSKALADTGVSRERVKQVLERLFEKGLLEPVTPAA